MDAERSSKKTTILVLVGVVTVLVLAAFILPSLLMQIFTGMGGMAGMGGMMGQPGLPPWPTWLTLILWLLLAAGLILLFAWSVRRIVRGASQCEQDEALAILRRRFAEGEIGQEEYTRIRAELLGHDGERSDPRMGEGASGAPSRQLGPWAAGLSLAAGLIHLVATPEHLQEWLGYGYFFLAAGIVQITYAQLLFRTPRRTRAFYAAGLVGTLAIITLYVVTRTVGIPFFGPAAGEIEPIGALDAPSKLVEVSLLAILTTLILRPRNAATDASRPGRSTAAPTRATDGDHRRSRISRRPVLLGAAGGILGALALAVGWLELKLAASKPPSDPRVTGAIATPTVQPSAGGLVQVALTTREVEWELAPGKRVQALTYDGQVPGPAIRVLEGQRLRVVLTNRLTVPTTIHWHGVDLPNPMDGVPDLTQLPVPPGRSFVYEFDARPAGTRWYHTHFGSTKQFDHGLYAPLIVEPAEPELNRPDREYILVFSSWVTGQGSAVPRRAADRVAA